MERTRTMLVIQRAYPSRCWTVETRISEVTLPHATTFPHSRFARFFPPCSRETSGHGVEIRYNEKQRRTISQKFARERNTRPAFITNIILLRCVIYICEL